MDRWDREMMSQMLTMLVGAFVLIGLIITIANWADGAGFWTSIFYGIATILGCILALVIVIATIFAIRLVNSITFLSGSLGVGK